MHQTATQWIVELLRDRDIPFLICGGLAARAYGSQRDLNDIDLFVPSDRFSPVAEAGHEFVSKAAGHRTEEGWDLSYVQFRYEGVKVEVGSDDGPRIFDSRSEKWIDLGIDFSRFAIMPLLGMNLPVMLKEDLIRYKTALSRPVDIEDIRAIREHVAPAR